MFSNIKYYFSFRIHTHIVKIVQNDNNKLNKRSNYTSVSSIIMIETTIKQMVLQILFILNRKNLIKLGFLIRSAGRMKHKIEIDRVK